MTEINAKLLKEGISVPPGKEIQLQTNYTIADAIFTPRSPRLHDNKHKKEKAKLKPTGPDLNLDPWKVS